MTAPKIPAAVADEVDVTDGPRGGWTMLFGTEDTGVRGKAWSTSARYLEVIAGAYAEMRASEAYAGLCAAQAASQAAAK